jgi:hypothetical protein
MINNKNTSITFYALRVSFLNDIEGGKESIVLRRAWLTPPTQNQIDVTVQQWIYNFNQACDEKKYFYKVKKILSVKVIDFIVDGELICKE